MCQLWKGTPATFQDSVGLSQLQILSPLCNVLSNRQTSKRGATFDHQTTYLPSMFWQKSLRELRASARRTLKLSETIQCHTNGLSPVSLTPPPGDVQAHFTNTPCPSRTHTRTHTQVPCTANEGPAYKCESAEKLQFRRLCDNEISV